MQFESFSPKQRAVLTWWCETSPWKDREAIICDGAVRSGKTLCTGLSFFCWAMARFHGCAFGVCGKTVISLRRNLIRSLLPALRQLGFRCTEKLSQNLITVSFGKRENTFHLFGGRDESSAALIQGVTLAGVLIANGRSQAVTDTKLEELTREVRKHNHFAERIPVIEERIKVADHRIRDLEDRMGPH